MYKLTRSNKMSRKITIKDLIVKATKNPENIKEDGSVNWNFVDADIHLDNAELKLGFTSKQLFEELESFNA